MSSITVTTKKELESAKENLIEEIIVSGKLADDLKKSKNIALASGVTLGVLAAALAAIPFTGGLSVFAAAPVAALTGLEIAAIIAAASVGLALVIALFKDYEEVSYDNGKMVLKKRSN
jgi:NADH:ubiquinone oxidoreductase subunit K